MRDVRQSIPSLTGAPSGPKVREWGKPQGSQDSPKAEGFGKGAQGYNKPVGFVKAEDAKAGRDPLGYDTDKATKTDEELEAERKEQRRLEEELSYKDVSITHANSYSKLTCHSVNVDMNPESERGYRRLNGLSRVRMLRGKRKCAIGSKSRPVSMSGMMTRVTSYSTSIGKHWFFIARQCF